MAATGVPSEVRWLGRLLLLVAPTAVPLLLVDIAFAAMTAADPTIEVGVPAIGIQAVLVGIGAALFALARRFLIGSRGRGTGMLLTGTGLLCATYLAYLAVLAVSAPVCDFGNGDACAYGTAGAPLPYAVLRVQSTLVAAVVPLLTLVLLARSATFTWLTRDRPLLRALLSTRPFAVTLAIGSGAAIVLAVLHFPAVAVRLAGIETAGSFSLGETTTKAYTHAGVLAALAVLVAAATCWLGVQAWRVARPATVRALGGAVVMAQVLWLFVAIAQDPVRLARFGLYESPIPVWFHASQGALALTLLLACLASLTALVLAKPGHSCQEARRADRRSGSLRRHAGECEP